MVARLKNRLSSFRYGQQFYYISLSRKGLGSNPDFGVNSIDITIKSML